MSKVNQDKFNRIRIYSKIVIALLVSVAVCFGLELFFNRNVLRLNQAERVKYKFDLENEAIIHGFEEKDNRLVMNKKEASVKIHVSRRYIKQIAFSFACEKDMVAMVKYWQGEENAEDNQKICIVDANNRAISYSQVQVGDEIDYFEIIFSNPESEIELLEVEYDNTFSFSARRMFAIGVFVFTILILLMYSDCFFRRLELGFLCVSLAACLCVIFTFPAQKISWDEEYHFIRSYETGLGFERVITPEIKYYSNDGEVATLFYPQSNSEFDQIENYLDKSNLYDKNAEDNQIKKSGLLKLSDIGHIPSAIGITIGLLLKLSLTKVYMLGKIFNMLFYILLTYFAVKRLTVCKYLFTGIALMPTTLFLAATYSYDATLNACAFLAVAYIISEISEPDKKMTWQTYIVFMLSVAVASAIKMVYAPMFLLLLAIPDKKFSKKSDKIIMKYGVFILCAIVLAIMMLPVLINPDATGDLRGGATSHSGQMQYIFGHFFSFADMLRKSILDNILEYSIGNSIFGSYAHYGFYSKLGYISLFLTFLVITDTDGNALKLKSKIIIGLDVLLIVCFVWTAMYISFTPVGLNQINGVQGRYFIPVTFLFLIMINSKKIKCEINKKVYSQITLIVPLIFNFTFILEKAIENCV